MKDTSPGAEGEGQDREEWKRGEDAQKKTEEF